MEGYHLNVIDIQRQSEEVDKHNLKGRIKVIQVVNVL